MTRYYIDEEFAEDGKTIALISIGIISEDGRELYLQSVDFDEYKVNPWVQEHVLPHLLLCPCCGHKCNHEDVGKCRSKLCMWRTDEQIKQEVTAFMDPEKYGKPQFIGWCCSYDHVALCQLFGPMVNIPAGWPYHIHDIQCVLEDRKIPDDQLPQQEGQVHNALQDARQIKKIWEMLYHAK